MSTIVQQYTDLAGNVLWSMDDSGNVASSGNLTQTGSISSNSGTNLGSQIAKVVTTSAQLLALRATPKLLIAAPGAGKYIKVLGIDMHYTFVTGAYTNTNAALKVFYGTTASAKAISADQTALLLNTVNAHTLNIAVVVQASLTDVLGLNVGIYLGNDGSAEFLAGAGTLEVVVAYTIVTP